MTEPEKLYRTVGIYDDDFLRRVNERRDTARFGLHPTESVLTNKPVRTAAAAKAAITSARRYDDRRSTPMYKDYRIDVVELKWEEWKP